MKGAEQKVQNTLPKGAGKLDRGYWSRQGMGDKKHTQKLYGRGRPGRQQTLHEGAEQERRWTLHSGGWFQGTVDPTREQSRVTRTLDGGDST